MQSVVVISVLISLATQTFPVALGVSARNSFLKPLFYTLILAFTQLVLFWAGLSLGNLFMHWMDSFGGVIVFAGFSLIGIRMFMEVFTIRKGERTYLFDGFVPALFSSLAQSVNTFLAGLLFSFYAMIQIPQYGILLISAYLLATLGVWLSPTKNNLSLAAFFYFLGGLIMLAAGIYLAFFV
jgi:putative Mn2+ efflux pump MntP